MKYIQIKIILSYIFILSWTILSAQVHFNEHIIDTNTRGAGGLAAGDFDGDSDIDIIAASLEDDQIIMFRNEGSDTILWTKQIIAENIDNAHSVYSADFDNDGDLDIVAAAYQGSPGVLWLRNDGGNPINWSQFTVATTFYNAHEVYSYDIDLDGRMDIIGASSDLNKISWWRNTGGDTIEWVEQVISNHVEKAKSARVADFDGDGDMDIVGVAITAHKILWWENRGSDPIEWTEHLVDGHFLGPHRAEPVDMDYDGDMDILCAGYLGHEVAWWRNEGGDTILWKKESIASGVTNACIAQAADIDNDNDLDIVATAQGKNEILLFLNDNGTSTVWVEQIISDYLLRPWPLIVCDLDQDNDLDIVSASSHQGSAEVIWWENDLDVGISNMNIQTNRDSLYCYPNPFREHLHIKVDIQYGGEVELLLLNSNGQMVSILFAGHLPKGTHYFEYHEPNLLQGVYGLSLRNDHIFETYSRVIRVD